MKVSFLGKYHVRVQCLKFGMINYRPWGLFALATGCRDESISQPSRGMIELGSKWSIRTLGGLGDSGPLVAYQPEYRAPDETGWAI